jgi:hypothetical protein
LSTTSKGKYLTKKWPRVSGLPLVKKQASLKENI